MKISSRGGASDVGGRVIEGIKTIERKRCNKRRREREREREREKERVCVCVCEKGTYQPQERPDGRETVQPQQR